VAIAIKLDSPGPVFYGGLRAGRNGKSFKIWKFRTMYERPDSYNGPKITGENDTRITKVGYWLRQSKLNELPQLWNVLVGEMSLVGPRPEDPGIVETWPKDVREEILSLRPGVTSPASVLYRDEETMLAPGSLMETYFGVIQPSKIRLDQLYIRHRSFWVDLDIFLWTALVLLPGLSSFKPRERQLVVGVWQRGVNYLSNWFVIDFAVALLSISISGVVWRLVGPLDIGVGKSVLSAFYFATIFTIIGAMIGIQKIHWSKASPTEIYWLMWTFFIATFVLLGINLYVRFAPTRLILTATVMTFIGMVITRFRTRLVTGTVTQWLRLRRSESLYQERVLIIGSGDAGSYAAWMLANSREGAKFKIVGFLDDDISLEGTRIRGISVLGNTSEIEETVKKYDVGIILYAIHNIDEETSQVILERCKNTPAQVIQFPDVIGHLSEALNRNGELSDDPYNIPIVGDEQDYDEMLQIVAQLKEKEKPAGKTEYSDKLNRLEELIERQRHGN
jgi:lipopolysaccharide/colanic/teichoic acid biosynthesis glycosyltransferase